MTLKYGRLRQAKARVKPSITVARALGKAGPEKHNGWQHPAQMLGSEYVLQAPASAMPTPDTSGPKSSRLDINWLDVPWLVFLAGLAILPPIWEVHKQLVLGALAAVQLVEAKVVRRYPSRGPVYAVAIKLLLATVLIAHTGELSINSSYYPIYYLPIITAALYFSPLVTLLWTVLASAAYLSYLIPALEDYAIDAAGWTILAIRIFFIFLVAMVVNRVVVESRRQSKSYQLLAEQLTETNRQLERAQAETRRSERLAALGQLTAGLAHEIRNPLGIIKGSAEMLGQKVANTNPLAAELAGYISSEVNRLSALVSRFLNFARPLQPELASADLTATLERSLKAVQDPWQGASIAVERDYQLDLPLVPIDAALCEQVFVNLLQNAFDAMQSNGGTLRLHVAAANSNGRAGIEVTMQDSGPGIPLAMREQIFNPFVTTKPTGVGLGLSIVSQIMDEHHGSIRLLDTEGLGAGFALFFPLDPASEAPAEPIAEAV